VCPGAISGDAGNAPVNGDTFELSPPPSANKLFVSPKGTSKRFKTAAYKRWISGELKALIAQRARPVGVRAKVSIVLPAGRADMDNSIKGTLDLLVRAGVLQDDSRKHVAGVSVTGGTQPRFMLVTVEEFVGA
jgi:Holliday junction resolvase RusA-like endonuclease